MSESYADFYEEQLAEKKTIDEKINYITNEIGHGWTSDEWQNYLKECYLRPKLKELEGESNKERLFNDIKSFLSYINKENKEVKFKGAKTEDIEKQLKEFQILLEVHDNYDY